MLSKTFSSIYFVELGYSQTADYARRLVHDRAAVP